MAYLRDFDYHTLISETNLETILKQARGVLGDADILAASEVRGIASLKNSLRGRYIVDTVFAAFKEFDLSTDYLYDDRIDWTATGYSALTVYTSGQTVLYNGVVYEKNATTAGYVSGTLPTNATYFTNRGTEGVYYITPPDAFNEDLEYAVNDQVKYQHRYYICTVATDAGTLPTDTNYWERLTDLTPYAVTGEWPNGTGWTFGDNRESSIVECLIDFVLYDVHAVINPRNIPALRADRYAKSVEWLKDIRHGKYDIDLPEFGPQKGYKIRFGSNEQNVNFY